MVYFYHKKLLHSIHIKNIFEAREDPIGKLEVVFSNGTVLYFSEEDLEEGEVVKIGEGSQVLIHWVGKVPTKDTYYRLFEAENPKKQALYYKKGGDATESKAFQEWIAKKEINFLIQEE